jgi:hypothetical protein
VVHYFPDPGVEPGLAQLPWVATTPTTAGIVDHLFYYDNQNVWRQRRLPRVRIYSNRLDGAGSFSQQLSPTASNPRQLPSIVNVPTAGCWRLTLRAGATTGYLTVLAVPGHTS